jgi:hypothetical protein
MRGEVSWPLCLPSVATTTLLRGSVRLLAAICSLQRSRLRVHDRLLLRARFGGSENPAAAGRTAPELRQLRQKIRQLAAQWLNLLEHGPSRKP